MNASTKNEPMIRGTATHRRTQSDYLRALLDRVTLETWGDVVDATVAAAKSGDAQARTWLAQYLVGKPTGEAPTPLTVIVQQLAGDDPLVERLAKPAIHRVQYPSLSDDDDAEETIKAMIADELPAHIKGEP